MSQYFPKPETISLAPGVETQLFKLNDLNGTQIAISTIAPGATIDLHSHPEIQIGIALMGEFTMQVDGEEQILTPLTKAYVVDANKPHAAKNHGSEMAVGLDIKLSHIEASTLVNAEPKNFIQLVNHNTLKTGIRMEFFVTPWCEIMLSYIPPHAHMPSHQHKNEQYGIAVKGNYIMDVGAESETFSFGKIYYSPPGICHGAHNPYDEEAISLNMFIPPRYNLIPKRERILHALPQ